MASIEVFNNFDQAALSEAADNPPKSFPESLRRLSALIDKLPQRPVIEDKHAERWLNRCMEMAIVRMDLEHGEGNSSIADVHSHVLWHVRRASAIGGSEIGDVVRHFRGETGGFSNARNIVLEKLLIMSPQPGDEAMNRGVRAEPWIQKMYLEEMDATSDEAALDVLKGFRWENAPQIVGTPDDLVIFNKDGRRRIVDYKCPSAAVNEEYEKKGTVSFDYHCQVHQYGIFSRLAGIKFEGMDIICFDPRSFSLKTYEIELDTDLVKEMLQSSATLWNEFVMKGELPVVPGPAKLNTEDEELLSEMKNLTMQAAVLKVIEDEVGTRKKEVLDRIKSVEDEAHENAEGKIDLEFASFDRKRSWDEEQLCAMAVSAGIEPQDYYEDGKSFDSKPAEKMLKEIFAAHSEEEADLPALISDMAEAGGVPYKQVLNVEELIKDLEGLGVSITAAAGVSEKFSLSRAKKHADKVRVLKDQAIQLTDTIEEVVEAEAPRLLRDPEQVAAEEAEADMMM